MTRIVQIGNATLYNGDCLEIIPGLKGVTKVLTDPPYGIEDIVGGYGRSGETIANDRNLDVCMAALQAVCRIAPAALWMVFYSPRIKRQFFELLPPELHDLGEIIWDKKAPGMGQGIRYQHENIAVLYTGDPKKLTRNIFSVTKDYRCAKLHPHQKPDGLITSLAEAMGEGTYLDPFMGSGTTGVACATLGVPFIGIELDPKHFVTCVQRITNAHNAPQMFGAENDNVPVQADLLAS